MNDAERKYYESKNRPIDPLPDEFSSVEEAAEFWDTHSLTDYEDVLEAVDLEVKIEKRICQCYK